jgi:hypothetical protein
MAVEPITCLLFAGFLLGAYGTGVWAVAGVWDGQKPGGAAQEAVFAVSIGLLFLSLWTFLLGVSGFLKPFAYLPFLFAGSIGFSRYFRNARLSLAVTSRVSLFCRKVITQA